ncbi:PRC-barrel domain-containing protein [Brachybacterium fresconis]|uniref:PRC-barrel domain-containing protein n=1 Tax=Brachybacterium fresconis TaxID=173363 RepID=A0ABS4YMF4_9MICO|nr:hypothetical protein [Brachybacterium fresconis]
MTETSGGETPAEHPEGDGFAVSAGATPQLGAEDARTSGSGAVSSDADEATGPGDGITDGEAEEGSSDAGRLARRARLQALAGVTVLGSDGAQVGRVRDIYVHDATGELAGITVVRRQLSSRSVLIPTAAIAVLPAPHTEPEEPDGRRRADAQIAAARRGGDSAGPDGADGSDSPDGSDASDGRATARRTSDRQHRRAAVDRDADPAHPQALWLFVDAASARAGLRPPDTLHASPQTLREAARAVGLEETSGDGGPRVTADGGPGVIAAGTAGPEEAAAG